MESFLLIQPVVWLLASIYFYRKSKSLVIIIGGGFLVGALALVVCIPFLPLIADTSTSEETAEANAGPRMLVDAPDKLHWTETEVALVQGALSRFKAQCSPMAHYWNDVVSGTVTLRDTVATSLQDKGWKRNVYLKVQIKEKPESIPKSYRAWGQTCHYDIGIGPHHGMQVGKAPCQKLCAMTKAEMGEDYVRLDKVVAFEDAPEELHIKKVESQFSAWDGSHRNLERLLKANLNDPDSYEHDETVYWDRSDHLVVSMSYRAKNAFGALVKGHLKAKVSMDGEVLEIMDSY